MKNKNSNKISPKERIRWIRNIVQLIFLLLMPSLFAQAFGGAKEIIEELGKGSIIVWSSFIFRLVVLIFFTIFMGRVFCGWACTFGAIGDWIYQLSAFIQKKSGKKLPQIPEKLLHILQKLKYVVLFVILIFCFFNKKGIVTKYSPWTVFSLILTGNFNLSGYGISIFLLLLIVLGMAIQERFFCQCLCPLGAIFSLLPELPITSWKRNNENCISGCQACKKNCPVNIKLNENPFWEGECIRCGRCSSVCPRKNIRTGILNHWRKSTENEELLASIHSHK